jgi:CBS domain-containing protein
MFKIKILESSLLFAIIIIMTAISAFIVININLTIVSTTTNNGDKFSCPLRNSYIFNIPIYKNHVRQYSINMNALDLMSVNVVAAKQNLVASEISARLLLGEFNGVPVIDDNQKVIGIVTAIDILKAVREGKNLSNTTARDIMTPNPSVVKKDTSMEEIMDIMIEKEIVLVPVVQDEDDGKLIGVVARLDILRQKLNEGFVTIGERKGVAKT